MDTTTDDYINYKHEPKDYDYSFEDSYSATNSS